MAVAYVNGDMAAQVTTDGASATITLGWTPTAGELLVVIMKGQYDVALPAWGLSGFTALPRQSATFSSLLNATQVWWKVATGSETTLTCTQSTASNTSTSFRPHVFGFSGAPSPPNIQHEQEIVSATAGVDVTPSGSTATGAGLAVFARARSNSLGTGNAISVANGFTQRSIGTWGSQSPSSMLADKTVTAGSISWPQSSNAINQTWLLEKIVLYDDAAIIPGGIYVDGAVHLA